MKKVKICIRKIFSTVLMIAILAAGVLNQVKTAHAQVYSWMSAAETINLGQAYNGMTDPSRSSVYLDKYFYIYLPANMNITLNVREKGTQHFDWINIYNSNGQREQFLYDGWNYSRNTDQSVCTKK